VPARPAQASSSAVDSGVVSGVASSGDDRPAPTAPFAVPFGANAPATILTEILGTAQIARIIDRIAHQILERNGDQPVVLLGIPTRGVHLAGRLADRLTAFTGRPTPVGSLDITLYRDDLRRRPPRALEETRIPAGGVDDAIVVLVDDVLYSGRTIRAALDALRDLGRPAAIQLAVLVDRGHRQLPIRADYVGKNIPTAFGDDVAVRLIEIDGIDSVELARAVPTRETPSGPAAELEGERTS